MDTQLNDVKTSLIPWLSIDEDKNIRAKVLSLNLSTKNVELLFKIKAGYRSGPHRHTCETKIYVVSGEVLIITLKNPLGRVIIVSNLRTISMMKSF